MESGGVVAYFNYKDHDRLQGSRWIEDKTGETYYLHGILWADDWYWEMVPEKGCKYKWLSCVCNIENFGFTLKDNDG